MRKVAEWHRISMIDPSLDVFEFISFITLYVKSEF